MAEKIKDFLVGIGVDPDTEAVKRFTSNLNKAKGAMRSIVATGAKVAAAMSAVGGGLFAVAKKTADAGDEAAKTSQQVGMTAEAFQKLKHAAAIADVSVQELRTGLRRGARNFSDFADGTGQAKDAIEDLGIQVTDSNGEVRSTEALITDAAEAFSEMENETRKTAYANEIFGRSGAKLLPLFNEGADGVERLKQEAQDLGVVLDEEAVRQSANFQDALHRARQTIKGLVYTAGEELIPRVIDAAQAVQEWVKANKDWLDTQINDVVNNLADRVEEEAELIPKYAKRVQKVIDLLGGWEDAMNAVIKSISTFVALSLVSSLWTLGSALYGMVTALFSVSGATAAFTAASGGLSSAVGVAAATLGAFLAKIIAVVAALAAVALAIEDVYTYFQGGESITGKFVEWFKSTEKGARILGELKKAAASITAAFEELLDVGKMLWPYIRSAGAKTLQMIGKNFQMMWNLVEPVFTLILSGFKNIFRVFRAVLHAFQGEWGKAWGLLKKAARGQLKALWQFFKSMLSGVWKNIKMVFTRIKDLVSTAASWVPGINVEGSVDQNVSGPAAPASGSGQVNTPSPARAAKAEMGRQGGGTQRVEMNAQNKIEVKPPPGASEERVASLVDEKLDAKESEQAERIKKNIATGGER